MAEGTTQRRPGAPKVQLSCEMCRQRKVKCDKLSPCTNCQRLGAVCIPVERARLPRGRFRKAKAADRVPESDSADATDELKGRLERLEGLICALIQDNGAAANTIVPAMADAEILPSPCGTEFRSDLFSPVGNDVQEGGGLVAQKPSAYLGNSFWESLMHVQNRSLRNLMNQRPDGATFAPYDILVHGLTGRALFSPLCSTTEPWATPQLQQHLCHVFLTQVDPVFKILHQPSLRAFLIKGKPYLHYDAHHPAPEALRCAVYYTAACSTTEDQWPSALGASRASVIANYQKETEAALVRAEFVTSDDLTVLQAFVLSLIGARSQDRSRRAWTMLSMAVRVAQALSLHVPDSPFLTTPFEQEMRRRLWGAIGLLDVQASLDRASEPMILRSCLELHAPLNVSDDDIPFGHENVPAESDGFTDTTFTLIISKAQCAVRSLTEPGSQYMHIRQACVADFQQTASQLLRNCQPDAVPFHWYTLQVTDYIAASMQLIALRPLQRTPDFMPPQVPGFNLLRLSVAILQKMETLHSDPRGHPWRWFEGIFVPWHALAVAIAELCECEDAALIEQYWETVEGAFERLGGLVADEKEGMLWKPMERLMGRARAKRDILRVEFTPESASAQSQPSFLPVMTPDQSQKQKMGLVLMPCSSTSGGIGLEPWADVPSVWDGVDFGDVGIVQLSWTNYQDLMEDIQR